MTYWIINALKVKSTAQRQSRISRFIYLLFMVSGFTIIYAKVFAIGIFGDQVIPKNDITGAIGLAICISGVAFAIWARYTLGTNWSGEVTLKKEHELVQSGPYSIVRHPIYTGFDIGLLGVAITIGQLKGIVGLSLVFCCHYYKTTMEEKIMYAQFTEQYVGYAKRVKRLIPFIF
jgi:protein-S-isoprenylcysteine O-methyltransferase Ste14